MERYKKVGDYGVVSYDVNTHDSSISFVDGELSLRVGESIVSVYDLSIGEAEMVLDGLLVLMNKVVGELESESNKEMGIVDKIHPVVREFLNV